MAKETGSEIFFLAAANVARRIEMVLAHERGQRSDKRPCQMVLADVLGLVSIFG